MKTQFKLHHVALGLSVLGLALFTGCKPKPEPPPNVDEKIIYRPFQTGTVPIVAMDTISGTTGGPYAWKILVISRTDPGSDVSGRVQFFGPHGKVQVTGYTDDTPLTFTQVNGFYQAVMDLTVQKAFSSGTGPDIDTDIVAEINLYKGGYAANKPASVTVARQAFFKFKY